MGDSSQGLLLGRRVQLGRWRDIGGFAFRKEVLLTREWEVRALAAVMSRAQTANRLLPATEGWEFDHRPQCPSLDASDHSSEATMAMMVGYEITCLRRDSNCRHAAPAHDSPPLIHANLPMRALRSPSYQHGSAPRPTGSSRTVELRLWLQ